MTDSRTEERGERWEGFSMEDFELEAAEEDLRLEGRRGALGAGAWATAAASKKLKDEGWCFFGVCACDNRCCVRWGRLDTTVSDSTGCDSVFPMEWAKVKSEKKRKKKTKRSKDPTIKFKVGTINCAQLYFQTPLSNLATPQMRSLQLSRSIHKVTVTALIIDFSAKE